MTGDDTLRMWLALSATERDVFRGLVAAQQFDRVGAAEIVETVPGDYSPAQITQTIADLVEKGFVAHHYDHDKPWRPYPDGLRAYERSVTRDAQALVALNDARWPVVPFSELERLDDHELLLDCLTTEAIDVELVDDSLQQRNRALLDDCDGPLRCSCGEIFDGLEEAYRHQQEFQS